MSTSATDHDVADLGLADLGRQRIAWADANMPVLTSIRERFAKERPLAGAVAAACLHVTTETANLLRTLKAGGAEVLICASNPLSTQDDVAASLVRDEGIPTFAVKGEDSELYYSHIDALLDRHPTMTMDDGCDLVSRIHQTRPGPGVGDPGRHRGDHDRRHPAARHGGRRRAQVPDRRRQRRRHQAHVRQPLRHRAVHPRRRHPGHQRPAGGQARRGGRVRLLRQGRGEPGPRATGPRSS